MRLEVNMCSWNYTVEKVRNCSWVNFWSYGKRVQIVKCTYSAIGKTKAKTIWLSTLVGKHSVCYVFGVLFNIYLKKFQFGKEIAIMLSLTFLCMFVVGSWCGESQCSCNRRSFRCNNSASSITGGLLWQIAWPGFCVYNYNYTKFQVGPQPPLS